MSNHNLKACPFCGKEVAIFTYSRYEGCRHTPTITYGIGCDTKDCWCERDNDNAFYNKDEIQFMVQQWNKREQ